MKRYIIFRMKQYYISMKDELQHENRFYAEELGKKDWEPLKKAGEIFLIHAYSHLFEITSHANKIAEHIGVDASRLRIFWDDEYDIKYGQFYLNLAVGLELMLKSILLRKGIQVNQTLKKRSADNILDQEHTISFGTIINKHLRSIFPNLIDDTREEIKDTLRLI